MNNIPSNYRPLNPWEYFLYSILFSIPVIGFILLILYSFDNSNINRKNFARSYFCIYILIIVLIFIYAVIISNIGIETRNYV